MASLRLLVLLPVLLLAPSYPAEAITFNDGLTHVIDATNSVPSDAISLVLDRPDGAPSTLEVATGGQVGTAVNGTLRVLGSSVIRHRG